MTTSKIKKHINSYFNTKSIKYEVREIDYSNSVLKFDFLFEYKVVIQGNVEIDENYLSRWLNGVYNDVLRQIKIHKRLHILYHYEHGFTYEYLKTLTDKEIDVIINYIK